ncbi:MAG: hypothetical protein ABI619_01860 [Betaproteobacteria bacterium]
MMPTNGGQGMPQFVEYDAGEQGDNESDAGQDQRCVFTSGNVNICNPSQQDEERPMDENSDASNPTKL